MSDHPLTLSIPESLYERLQQIAEATAQPVEQVALWQLQDAVTDSQLAALPADEQIELAAFKLLSDATLFSIAREQMSRTTQQRMIVLGDKLSRGTIAEDEHAEYSAFVEQGDRLMVRKAWAAGVLMDRGHSITADDMAAPDE